MTGVVTTPSNPIPEYLAFGDISVDVAVQVPHLPQPDEKQWCELIGEHPGGMAANAASAFSALGGAAGVIALVGSDDYGEQSLNDLLERGVDTSFVRKIPGRTFWTFALLAPGGEKSLVQCRTPAFFADLETFNFAVLDTTRFVHAIPENGSSALRLLREAHARGNTTSLDIEETMLESLNLGSFLSVTDILFISAPAARHINPNPGKAAQDLRELGAGSVIITLGAEGCFLLDQSERELFLPGHKVETVDTTGAGDCFAGAFAYGIQNNWTSVESAELANLMAAISTTAYGSRGAITRASELNQKAKEAGFAWWDRLK